MRHNKTLASFIIPVYNTEKYLERCLSSVTAIRNSNIEIIIVDDGSTDNSPSIYDRYAKADNRITIIKQRNKGVSSARNKGIQTASGEWITFIDSDDEIVPAVYDAILVQVSIISELWILGTMMRYSDPCDSARTIIQGIWLDKDIEMIKRGIFHQDMESAKSMRKQGFYFGGPWAKFYKKEIITENNLSFRENLSIGEDCVFNFEYLSYVNTISYTNECGYYYWQNNDSAIHKFKKGKGKQFLDTVQYVSDILKENYLEEYAQYGVRYYLNALKIDWCHSNNNNSYFIRRSEAMQWRNKPFIQEAFQSIRLLQIRWEAIPIAFCAKMRWFLLCDLLLKTKEKLHIRFK